MKILTVLEGPSWVDYHLAGSLESMGHELTRFVYGSHVGEFYPRHRASELQEKNANLLALASDLHRQQNLDLIFCYVYDDFLLPDTARALAALDVPMVNFNVDMTNQWYRQIRTARYFTRMLCAHRVNMDALARHGGKVFYFPMAARLHEPEGDTASAWQPSAPVTFVGTPMRYRNRVLQMLLEEGVPLAVYGKFWQEQLQATPDYSLEKTLSDIHHYAWARLRTEGAGMLSRVFRERFARPASKPLETIPANILHGFVPDGCMSALFSKSAINLGFTRMVGDDPWRAGINQIKLRDFEVPMAGGFYLVEKAVDYEQLFVPGKEVETWVTPDELREKITYYLEHPAERTAIAAAGAARARADHSWEQRFCMLFRELGLQEKK